MKEMLKKVTKVASSPIRGKAGFVQKIYETVYLASLYGMNFGGGSNLSDSGEKFVLQYVKKNWTKNLERTPLILFDVGANLGAYTKLALAVFSSLSIEIFSFEPSPFTFEKLKEKIGDRNNVKIFNIGLGCYNGEMSLFQDERGSGIASLYNRRLEHFNIQLMEKEKVKIETLDDFCGKYGLEHIDFLKLDVEGHELKVLQGGRRMLDANAIDFIQFEFGGCNIDSRTYFQDFFYFLRDRYNLYRVLRNGLYPIRQYKERYEIFLTSNYLAERKELGRVAIQ